MELLFDVTTLKMARKTMKLQKENPAEYAGEKPQSRERNLFIYGKNRVKEIRIREKGGLKLTDNSIL